MARTIHAVLAVACLILAAPAVPGADVPDRQKGNDWMRLGLRIDRDHGVPGLGFRVVPDEEGGWPCLKKLNFADRRTTYTWPTVFCDLGEVRVPGVERPGRPEQRGDWTHVQISCGTGQAPPLRLWAGRVCPALVLRTPKDALRLFCDRRDFAGFEGRGQPVWKAGGPPEHVAGAGVWRLCWFGRGSGIVDCPRPYPHRGRYWINPQFPEADCPVLLVFDSPPRSVSVGEEGVTVKFGDRAASALHSVAVLPLRGDLFPPVEETEKWADRLPEGVRRECEWWAEHLAEVPYSVSESYDYDATGDVITLKEQVKYLKLRDGGTRLAPVPPMVALAMRQGFPVKLTAGGRKARYVASSAPTFFGPWGGVEGVDRYQLKVHGLGRLVRERRSVGEPTQEDGPLVRELEARIEKMLQAGHLAPWYDARNCYGAGYRCYWRHQTRFVWSNPGETLYVLAQCLPLLSPDLRERAIDYMKRERTEYPPEEVVHTPVLEGARRERHRVEDTATYERHQELVNGHHFHIANDLIPEESLYYLAAYYEASGGDGVGVAKLEKFRGILEPYLRRQDWATLGFRPFRRPTGLCRSGWGGVHDANCHFAGLIGYLRLARMAGGRGPDNCWGQLARAAMWRCALGRYARYAAERGFYETPDDPEWMAKWFDGSWVGHMITYHWTGPLDDVRQVTRQSPYGVQLSNSPMDRFHPQSIVPFLGAVPELGRLARRHLRPELESFSERYERTNPGWFIAKCRTNVNAEFEYLAPEESYQVFLIRAWVLDEPADRLESYLDTPWMERGDLYYIHKLAETVKAYRGTRWAARGE